MRGHPTPIGTHLQKELVLERYLGRQDCHLVNDRGRQRRPRPSTRSLAVARTHPHQ